MRRRVSVAMGLRSINDPAELFLLLLRQINISRCPVLLQPLYLRRTRDCNHTLGGNPSECDLTDTAALPNSKLLNLLNNGLVLEEILTLELGRCVKRDTLIYHYYPHHNCDQTEDHLQERRKSSGAKSSGVL